MSDTRYVFDNAHGETRERFPALSDLYDDETIRRLQAIGVAPGWQCLEVAAGGGSIAQWLAGQVGTSGRVLATDLDTRFLESLDDSAIEVRAHDIVRDPLPDSAFDLVHARLILVHLPERELALAKMVGALKPGGWLVCEEFDSLSMAADSAFHPDEYAPKAQAALQRVMASRGANTRYGRDLAARMRALGLVDIRADGRLAMWQGGSAGARLFRANFEQLREDLLRIGLLTQAELDDDLARLEDPRTLFSSPVMWTVSGRKPQGLP
ncbi:MAG TPA: methyltransferase domain-containing protein [Burkholderiaceae bacterium]